MVGAHNCLLCVCNLVYYVFFFTTLDADNRLIINTAQANWLTILLKLLDTTGWL